MTPLDLGALMLKHLPYEPNAQQTSLIAALARYCMPGDADAARVGEDRVFVLNGHAGTGKTSVVGALVRALAQAGVPTVLLAPTGRAAKVLSAACQAPASTIHRRIYRGDASAAAGYLPIVRDNRMEHAVFIVDEASMIGLGDDSGSRSSLLHDLVQYVFSGLDCRLVMLGDSAQLPPVGCDVSPALDPAVLRALGLKVTRAVITAPARQSARSGILHNATLQRRLIGADPPQLPVIRASGFRDVRVLEEREDIADAIEADYSASPGGAADTVIITRSNRRATEFNAAVRSMILGYDDPLTVGERLMVVKNNYHWGARIPGLDFIANGDVAVVTRIIGTEERYGLQWADVELELPDREGTPPFQAKLMTDTLCSLSATLDPDLADLFERSILADPDLFAPSMSRDERLRALRNNPYWCALRVKYAYCVTCHKAQGGEWPNVYVDIGYLPPESSHAELCRWLYTATTRATRRLSFITPPLEVR